MTDRELKGLVIFLTVICLLLMFGSSEILNKSADKTRVIETLNSTVIELEKDTAALELENKELKAIVKSKNMEIAELKQSEREYIRLADTIENSIGYSAKETLNKLDMICQELGINQGGK